MDTYTGFGKAVSEIDGRVLSGEATWSEVSDWMKEVGRQSLLDKNGRDWDIGRVRNVCRRSVKGRPVISRGQWKGKTMICVAVEDQTLGGVQLSVQTEDGSRSNKAPEG
jgi:hypothetical protein